MARWILKEKHTLNVKGIEWEQVETLQETGEQVRHRWQVPLYLDPDDAGITRRWGQEGKLIVSDGNGNHSKDIIFSGFPTPGMEPLDEDAERITNECRPSWVHPIESLPGQGFAENLLQDLSKQLAAAIANQPKQAPIIGVDPEAFAQLQAQVAALMARNAELEAAKVDQRRV